MSVRRCPVMVETSKGRSAARITLSRTAAPVDVSLALREIGWTAYHVRFDAQIVAWIAKVIDWNEAA
jgi:hypothetical protein